jgi:nicotinamide phosphoribosyltransferase
MQPILKGDVEGLIAEAKAMGIYHPDTETKLMALVDLGYLPLEIKALPEGSVVGMPNAVCTIQNTVAGFHWVVGFVETLLLKWWSALATGACSLKYRRIVDKYFAETSDNDFLRPFAVHDFGSRGAMTPEGAAFTGMAHALNFDGSDTIVSAPLIRKFYNAEGMVICSVPASEHSVMCSFGREDEIKAFENMLDIYPTGIVSIVSDTYNWYNVMDNMTLQLKDRIMARDGKVVFRPDSGNPYHIICGEYTDKTLRKYCEESCQTHGGIHMLDKIFGHTVNSKGYKVLDSHVGLIYGDGMYLERFEKTLETLKDLGYSAENLVIGVGGILRNHTRDTLGAAFKATCVCRDGKWIPIMKDPITDQGKKSYQGFVSVIKEDGQYKTVEGGHPQDLLQTVFKDGQLVKDFTWQEVKDRYNSELGDR